MFKRGELTGTSLTGDQVEHYMQDPEWGQYVTCLLYTSRCV